MNLKHIKLAKEDKDAWHATDTRTGKSFRIAKANLSPTMHGRIAQHFAGGSHDAAGAPDYVQPDNTLGGESPDGWSVGGTWDALKEKLFPDSPDDQRMRASEEAAAASRAPAVPSEDPATAPARNLLGATATVPLAYSAAPGSRPGAPAPDADEVVPAPAPSSSAPGQAASPLAAAQAPAASVPIPSGTIPGLQPGLDKATAAEVAAVQANGEAQQQKAAEALRLQQKGLEEQEAVKGQWSARWDANQKRQQAIMDDISSSKIDPEHFWATRTTGQRVSGILGLLAGGFSAAYTGQGNPAERMLDKAIDQDIDAQEANLGKKQSELQFYMQQGHSIQEAMQLAKGDALQRTAAQLNMVATKYAGPEAKAGADMTAAQLNQKGLLLKQQAFGEGLSNSMKKLQLKAMQQQLAQAGKADPTAVLVDAARTGNLPPQYQAQLPKEIAGRVVNFTEDRPVTRDGRPVVDKDGTPLTQRVATTRIAKDDKTADKAADAMKSNMSMDKKVRALEEFVRKHPHGTATGEDNRSAAILLNDIKLEWAKAQENLSRYTDLESGTLDKMIADPGSIWGAATGQVGASVKYLRNSVNESKQGILDAYTVPSGR